MNQKTYNFYQRFLLSAAIILLASLGILGCHAILNKDKDLEAGNIKVENTTSVNEDLHTSTPDISTPDILTSDTLTSRKSHNLTLVSWNIQHLGRTKTSEDIYEIANILRGFDIVAVQEVVAKDPAGAQAVAKIADELNRMGAKWGYRISDPTKSPSNNISERYAFFWKTSKVSIVHRAYLDKELEDLCFREPYVAAFKVKGRGEPFYVVNYHSRKYTDKPEEEIIHFIDYPQRLDTDRILIAGDFNLNEKHDVWKPFYRRGFKNALNNQRTTLKMKCKDGDYLSHPIDNIYFLPGISKVQAGSVDFVENCDNLERARALSDHLPVYIEFDFEENDDF